MAVLPIYRSRAAVLRLKLFWSYIPNNYLTGVGYIFK